MERGDRLLARNRRLTGRVLSRRRRLGRRGLSRRLIALDDDRQRGRDSEGREAGGRRPQAPGGKHDRERCRARDGEQRDEHGARSATTRRRRHAVLDVDIEERDEVGSRGEGACRFAGRMVDRVRFAVVQAGRVVAG